MITNIIVAAMLTQLAFVSTDVEEPRIGFSFVGNSLVVVPVFLNGRGAYRFLLDTGASQTILSSSVADQLKLPAGKMQALVTASGALSAKIRTIETVQIGNVRVTNLPVAAADLDFLRALRVDGVIGADCLKQFKVSIDYAHQLLTIKPSSPGEYGSPAK